MTDFDINHNGYLELNEQLYKHVTTVRQIIDELNTTLRNLPEAISRDALTLYQQQQTAWNAHCSGMETKLNEHTLASINVHEIFKDGDACGTKIMLG